MFFAFLMNSLSSFAGEYRTKSSFKADYRCISEIAGGFIHAKSGHELATFKPDEEFYLIHISNIPTKAIFQLKKRGYISSPKEDEDSIREAFEQHNLVRNNLLRLMVSEKSAYFIRTSGENPSNEMIYILNSCSASALTVKDGSMDSGSISCYEGDSRKTFNFNSNSGRFTYSYAGTWDSGQKDNYYGDSSYFIYGTCKEYYR